MPEVTWIDDIHAPAEWRLRIAGKRPYQIAEMLPDILRRVLKVQTKDIFEHDVRYDVSVDPRTFYGFWEGRRQEDKWTRTSIRVTIQGEQSAAEGTGFLDIRLRGVLVTTYPYSNFIQRTFWWFYNRFYYYKQRRQYLFRDKDEIFQIKEMIQRTFAVSPEEIGG